MTTAVLGCGQLVTLRGPTRPRIGPEMRELGILKDGGLLIRDGIVQAVGSTSDIAAAIGSGVEIVDARGRLITPGLIDAHTHAIFGGNRANEFEMRAEGATYQEIKEAGGGILSSVRATRAASEEELVRLAKEKLRWMLKSGTTTLEVKSGYGLNLETELKMLRVAKKLGPQKVISTFLGAHAVPPEAPSKDAYVSVVLDMVPEAAKLAEYCDIFVEHGYFSEADAEEVLAAAKAVGLKPKLHVDQFTNGGAQIAARLGAKTAEHLEQTALPGIRALKESGVIPVLLPGSVYGLGLHMYPDARLMIEEGLPVVLATDFNPGSSPSPSLPFTMSLACTQMKMTPGEALTACTINAAYALDRGATIGSLEPGKSADFVIWDVDDYRELPYYSGIDHAESVWLDGVCVFNAC